MEYLAHCVNVDVVYASTTKEWTVLFWCSVTARNSDPILGKMLITLEADRRERTVVIAGLKEAPPDVPSSRRQEALEKEIASTLDAFDIEGHPVELYRIGSFDP
ncbi:hypothetical protein ANCDUO_10906 [Ancylostoma duodenale]|uniref:Uncharacterized protein n=1 Tax=Ancylostoma duodenale TaxID=51022 RepID=A0A0C2CQ60_9BILA|nr:hypothetical protein ANCDUO_10906 [Ancylostoma duodenale]